MNVNKKEELLNKLHGLILDEKVQLVKCNTYSKFNSTQFEIILSIDKSRMGWLTVNSVSDFCDGENLLKFSFTGLDEIIVTFREVALDVWTKFVFDISDAVRISHTKTLDKILKNLEDNNEIN
jgi:hypothetical protein